MGSQQINRQGNNCYHCLAHMLVFHGSIWGYQGVDLCRELRADGRCAIAGAQPAPMPITVNATPARLLTPSEAEL